MKKSIAGIACFGMFLVFAQPHASAADLSLSGMKFGQSVEDAQAVYKGLSPTEDINMGQVTIPPIAANPITYRLQGSNYDNKVMDMVVTYFTVPPEKQQLWYLTRSINYGDNKSAAPLTDAVISGLKDKYGAPTAEPDKGRTFLWVMDANGAPLTDKKQIDSILHFCTPTDPASVSLPDNIDGNHAMFERYCKSNIIVRALIEGASGQPVLRYAVWMQNTAIRTAADAKSAELVMKAENDKQQQEKDNAAKNAPKF